MKEDYLWDKTGEDAEVRALENALKAFRFQENAPPALPQNFFTIEKRSWRRFFQLGFGFAACASVVIVFSLFWFQFSSDKLPAAEIASRSNDLKTAERSANDSIIEVPNRAPVEAVKAALPIAKPTVVKIVQKRAPLPRPLKAVQRQPKAKEPSETLTAEEKYAYNQLMLALSITGTQLKIVKDKIQGIEDQNAGIETTK
jgi:hypothetical protein